MAKRDVSGIGRKAARQAKTKIARLGAFRAIMALFHYKHFLNQDGKRPLIHDETGRVIAPVCPELVPALMDAANRGAEERAEGRIEFNHFLAVEPRRQRLRKARRRTHEFNRAANLASERHEREIIPAAAPADETVLATPAIAEVRSIYQAVPAIYKPGGSNSRQFTVVVFFDGRGWFNAEGRGVDPDGWDRPKRRTVYYLEGDGRVVRATAKSGGSKSMLIGAMEESGWKWTKLGDEKFAAILDHIEHYGRDGEVAAQEVAA